MPKIKINDITMYYEIHGEGEPLILISGFSADHVTWHEVVPRLKNFYKVIIFDNRGAGQTDVPHKPYSIAQMSDDTAQLCYELNISKAHFVGNSMGGFILQHLAYKHPDLVSTMIISNSTTAAKCGFDFYLNAQLELLKAKAPLPALIKASCSWLFSYKFLMQPGMLDNLIELGLNNPFPFTVEGYENQYAALTQFNATDWIHEINVPTLIIGGDQDLIFPTHLVKILANQIPNAKYYSFHNCGHLPFMEYPELFTKVVMEFINHHQIETIPRGEFVP